jgi:hypothetical protein
MKRRERRVTLKQMLPVLGSLAFDTDNTPDCREYHPYVESIAARRLIFTGEPKVLFTILSLLSAYTQELEHET